VDGETAANSGAFGGWQSLGGLGLQQLAVANNAAGMPVVFAIGSDNGVYYQWENSPGSWSGPVWYGLGKPGGNNVQSISVGRDYGGKLVVAALDGSGTLWVITQLSPNSIGFGGWQELSTDSLQVALAHDASGRLTIFSLSGLNHAVYSWQEDTSDNWGGRNYLGGDVQSITAGRDAQGRMEVVAVGFDGMVYALRQTAADGAWGNWSAALGGIVWNGTLALGNEADGTLDVFADFNNIDGALLGYTRL
jgi:hypothetical protein